METISGSASFATKSSLFETTFLARGNVEALVMGLEAVAAVVGDVGLTVSSTGQSVTSPTVSTGTGIGAG